MELYHNTSSRRITLALALALALVALALALALLLLLLLSWRCNCWMAMVQEQVPPRQQPQRRPQLQGPALVLAQPVDTGCFV